MMAAGGVGASPVRRMHPLLVLGGGLFAGAAWGAFARLWMRFIADDPEFTWAGTLGIVIGFGIAGLGQAGSYLAGRAGLRRGWRTLIRVLGVLSLLPLGVAAGGPMLPAVVLAAVVWSRPEWPGPARTAMAAVCAVPVVAVARIVAVGLGAGKAVVGIAWFLLVYVVIAWAARFTLGPQRDGWRPPMALRVVGVVAVVGVAALGVALLGVQDL